MSKFSFLDQDLEELLRAVTISGEVLPEEVSTGQDTSRRRRAGKWRAQVRAGLMLTLFVPAVVLLHAQNPLQVSIAPLPSGVELSWSGGIAPFQLQTRIGFGDTWQDVGGPITNRSVVLAASQTTAFFRVSEWRPDLMVGQLEDGSFVVPTEQILPGIHPRVEFWHRPVDLVLSPDGRTAYFKGTYRIFVVDIAAWTLIQDILYPASQASMHGIAMSKDGSHLYVTGAGNELYDYLTTPDGQVSFSRTISLATNTSPCGIALTADGSRAYVCLSISNSLAVVDLLQGTMVQQIPVGVAPWDVVLSGDEATAYVSDWGGRHPVASDLKALSAGTPVVVDRRGIAASGAVSFVDLALNRETGVVPTGLHPSALALSPEGNTLYVANANSDTITRIDTRAKSVLETVLVRPDPKLPFGSAADGLALSNDGKYLYVACGGNNAVAVLEVPNQQHTNTVVQGFIPTDWYPGTVVTDGTNLYVANVKGVTGINMVSTLSGSAQKVAIPSLNTLSNYTAEVYTDARIREVVATGARAQAGQAPVPVPRNVGEPSVFKHILYIIKENKTYDNLFGDMPRGNGDSNLCIYPQLVAPNHHALAAQYVLLDNFYCNGVWSTDGHSWSTEGNATDYLEKSFFAFARGATFGNDPLTYSSSGFIWNNVQAHGLSFRNFGELTFAFPRPLGSTWLQIYQDYINRSGRIGFFNLIGISSLVPFTSTNVPGYNPSIPDVVRAEGFLKEFNAAQSSGIWPTFTILYLPEDHTMGATPGFPTPSAQIADNDLALGRVVEAVTRSVFSTNMVVFVIEDDPMGGYDHVDGHRSICLVISAYTKRGQTVSRFYNQTGVLHTMEQIMGLPPMNQIDAMSPLMTDCFTNVPDFTPYIALPNNIPLDMMNPGTTGPLSAKDLPWAKKSLRLDFSGPDRAKEDVLNRIIWHSIKGEARYPSEFVGPHGKGLKKLGLKLVKTGRDDDD